MAEQIASDWLLARGYTIRERNWRPSTGHKEIDIIAQIDDDIVFVEVKARSGEGVDPVDAVDLKKIRNLVNAADRYLSGIEYPVNYRFDIMTLSGSPADYRIDHYPDAFLAPLAGTVRKPEPDSSLSADGV